jgi:hypothetical protein
MWDIVSMKGMDDIPPKVSIITSNQEWVSSSNIKLECSDTGIDFSSGCNNSTYAFLISQAESCPREYSAYSGSMPASGSGFLCASIKDNEGNTAFSPPTQIKIDNTPPTTTTTEKTSGWLSSESQVALTDYDGESGLDKCFYAIDSDAANVLNWTARACNSSVSIPVGQGGCDREGSGACTVNAYATDKAGNKEQAQSSSYSIDLAAPIANITAVTPSRSGGGVLVVEGNVSIVGIASDTNFRMYTLEWRREGATGTISTSESPVYNKTLGYLDTSRLSNREYTLVLTVMDLSGKTSSFELKIKVSNSGQSCAAGTSQACSWLVGVCSSSMRICGSDGVWEECGTQNLTGYELPEWQCNDSLDNDCDGMADSADSDCGGNCTPVGSSCPGCSCGLPCCGAGCDPDGQHCFACLGGIDSVDSLCESDGTCGAADVCDEKAPGSVSTNNDQCCITGCSTDNTVGSCTCAGGNCLAGSCLTGTTCYHGVSCQASGWNASNCNTSDSCTENTLTVGKNCTGTGCGGTTYTCESLNNTNCQQVMCNGVNYYCTHDTPEYLEGWKWRTHPTNEDANCDDMVDNDCNGLVDCEPGIEDPACPCWEQCFDPLTANGDAVTYITYFKVFGYSIWSLNAIYAIGGLVEASPSDYNLTRTMIRWNISSIPDSAIIYAVTLKYHGVDRDSSIWGAIHSKQYDPAVFHGSTSQENAQFHFDDCWGSEFYVTGDGTFPLIGENQQLDLGIDAILDLGSHLDDDWFAVGITSGDELVNGTFHILARTYQGVPPTPKPTLCVRYSLTSSGE